MSQIRLFLTAPPVSSSFPQVLSCRLLVWICRTLLTYIYAYLCMRNILQSIGSDKTNNFSHEIYYWSGSESTQVSNRNSIGLLFGTFFQNYYDFPCIWRTKWAPRQFSPCNWTMPWAVRRCNTKKHKITRAKLS